MSKSTMIELVEELRKLPQCPGISVMIEEALAGEYHDYKNEKYICGKLESYNRLCQLSKKYNNPDMLSLASRIADGEFDKSADEEDKATMIKDIETNSSPSEAILLKKMLGL